jgi:AcrR family transcriptional regulator
MARGAKDENKERIIQAAEELFALKGFDGARVNEIAERAGVNKALIYYYFENKEAILDYLMKTLCDDVAAYSMDFARGHIVQMIREKRLDILADRFHFIQPEDLTAFLQSAKAFYQRLTDYLLNRRQALRILFLESLKNGKNRFNLFYFLDVLKADNSNPIYQTIKEADNDFEISEDMVALKFFFGLIPMVSFAVYFDSWRTYRDMDGTAMRDYFMRAVDHFWSMSVRGQDILIHQNTLF